MAAGMELFPCRYIVSQSGPITPQFVAGVLQDRFPKFAIQNGAEKDAEKKMDGAKVREELGLQLKPPSVTLIDMAVTAIQLGLAKPKLR